MRLIDADALIALINKRLKNSVIIGWLCSIIGEVPTIEARPVVRGEWRRCYDDSAGWVDMCDQCGEFGGGTNFCPICGADLRGEEDG